MAVVYTPEFQAATDGLRPLDLNRNLDTATIYSELPDYTAESRAIYLRFALADFVYPFAAAAFFALLWSRLFRGASHPLAVRAVSGGMLALPLTFMLIDWAENIGFLIVIFGYPERFPSVAAIAATLKGVKSYVLYSVMLLTVVFALLRFLRSLRSRSG